MTCSGLTDQPEREGTVDSHSRSGGVRAAHRTNRKSDSFRRCERSPQHTLSNDVRIQGARKLSRGSLDSLAVSETSRNDRKVGVGGAGARSDAAAASMRDLATIERSVWGRRDVIASTGAVDSHLATIERSVWGCRVFSAIVRALATIERSVWGRRRMSVLKPWANPRNDRKAGVGVQAVHGQDEAHDPWARTRGWCGGAGRPPGPFLKRV